MRRRIAASASRSAMVTGLASLLSSTAIFWRKYPRITAAAALARSSARARWAALTGSVMPRAPSLAGGQRLGTVGERVEIGDDVGPVLGIGQTGEGHLGALGEGLRAGQPLIELVDVPVALMVLQCRRELVA